MYWNIVSTYHTPHQVRQHSFIETDHETFSAAILSLPLIQERQLSVSEERQCTKTDSCPSWISGRERMIVENISWSISRKNVAGPGRDPNSNLLITSWMLAFLWRNKKIISTFRFNKLPYLELCTIMDDTDGDYLMIILGIFFFLSFLHKSICCGYSKACVRKPPLRLTLVVDMERWLSYKGTCHVILLAKLHDRYLYKTAAFASKITWHVPL